MEKERILRQSTRRDFMGIAGAGIFLPLLSPEILRASTTALGAQASALRGATHGMFKLVDPPTAEERVIAEEIASRIRHGFAMAIANPDTNFPSTSFPAIAQRYLRRQPVQKVTDARQRVQTLIKAPSPERDRTFGRFAGDSREAHQRGTSPANEALARRLRPSVQREAQAAASLAEIARRVNFGEVSDQQNKSQQKPIPKFTLPSYRYLQIEVIKVDCLTPEDAGGDELLLGGLGVYASGELNRIPAWTVHNNFQANTPPVTPNPPRKLCAFDLRQQSEPSWPRSYSGFISLADEDSGGFSTFLQEVWDQVGAEVQSLVSEAVTVLGAAALGTMIAPVIGTIVGAVVGLVVEWLLDLLEDEDDHLGTRVWRLDLLSPLKLYYADLQKKGLVTPFMMEFSGDGARYRVWLRWRVFD